MDFFKCYNNLKYYSCKLFSLIYIGNKYYDNVRTILKFQILTMIKIMKYLCFQILNIFTISTVNNLMFILVTSLLVIYYFIRKK